MPGRFLGTCKKYKSFGKDHKCTLTTHTHIHVHTHAHTHAYNIHIRTHTQARTHTRTHTAANVLVDYNQQRLKVADFGCAELLEECHGSEKAGTLAYNPPEVCTKINFFALN